jgi:hypothetical protein
MTREVLARFAGVDQVVADSLRFKRKLAIGEDAYTSIKLGKAAARIWDVGGVAATGAAVASSSAVAGTFFASTGWLATLGLGAVAVTPVGWVIAAAVASGGAYYGVTRLIGGYAGSKVEVIPKFINSPIDQLGAALLDMFGTLALKVAQVDGVIDPREKAAIEEYFVREWGFDGAYVPAALDVITESSPNVSMKQLAAGFSKFVEDNPDCNAPALRAEIMAILNEVAQADGVLDEREELALEVISNAIASGAAISPILTNLPKDAARASANLAGHGVGIAGKLAAKVAAVIQKRI